MHDEFHLHGCRHEVPGHYLKVIGLLAMCPDESHFNPTYQTEAGRYEYFTALEAADRRDWQPLTDIWKSRFGA